MLGCSQLELLPEKQKELADRSCGERKPDSLQGATVQYIAGKEPKDVRIWAGHFLDDDLIFGDDGLPIAVKATTAHEHYVVQPRSGPQPAPVPDRPRKGRDAAVSQTFARAQQQQAWAVQRETAAEVAAGPFADGGGGVSSGSSLQVTPANLGAKRSRWSEAALRHASND